MLAMVFSAMPFNWGSKLLFRNEFVDSLMDGPSFVWPHTDSAIHDGLGFFGRFSRNAAAKSPFGFNLNLISSRWSAVSEDKSKVQLKLLSRCYQLYLRLTERDVSCLHYLKVLHLSLRLLESLVHCGALSASFAGVPSYRRQGQELEPKTPTLITTFLLLLCPWCACFYAAYRIKFDINSNALVFLVASFFFLIGFIYALPQFLNILEE